MLSPALYRVLVNRRLRALGSMTHGYCSSIIATTLGQPSFIAYFHPDTAPTPRSSRAPSTALPSQWPRRLPRSIFITAIVALIGGALQAGSVSIAMYLVFRFLIGLAFYFVNASGAQWRLPLAIQCLPPLILAIGAFEAVQTESDDSVLNDRSAILEEFSTLKGLIQHEKLTHRFVDLFKSPGMRKRCFLGFLVMFGCQGTGTLVINNYGPTLYKALVFTTVSQPSKAAASPSASSSAQNPTAWLEPSSSSSGTWSAFRRPRPTSMRLKSFQLLRAKSLAVSVSRLFVVTIIFLQVAPTALRQLGGKTTRWRLAHFRRHPLFRHNYLVFLIISAICAVVFYFYYPETNQLSLENIGRLFGDKVER
ncbi:MFS transporter [Trichoderma sp. SZMC 28014]